MIRYSGRFPASFQPTAHASVLEQVRSSGVKLLDLTVSNPTLTLPDYPHPDIAGALGSIRDFSYEPDAFGLPSAREAIAGLYRFKGLDIPADRIALTASTSEAYSVLFKLLCDPGDEVLTPAPSYPLFEHLALFESVRIRSYLLRYDGAWHIDFSSLERNLSERTRAVVVVNPNNPTGSFLKRGEAERLAEWAGSNNLPILSDEVFTDYNWSESSSILDTFCRLSDVTSFSLNGLSKSCGMPQMKLGWLVLNGKKPQIEELRTRLELILDSYLSVNGPVQRALPRLLQIGTGICEELKLTAKSNLAWMQRELTRSAVHCLAVEGGWTAVLRLPHVRSEEDWLRGLLLDCSVLVQPGYFFDMASEPYVVISLITPCEVFQKGVGKLLEYVD